MPLTMAEVGRKFTVKRIGGTSKIATFLEGLGLVPGTEVSVVSKNTGGVILNVKESRVALGRDMASKVLV